MQFRDLLFAQFFVLVTLAFLYFIDLLLYLEWTFWWYDIVFHSIGGAWVALLLYTLFVFYGYEPHFARTLAGVICIGILWELFEFAIGAPREANYALDTSLDLLMDVVGGVFGFLLGQHIRYSTKA